MHDYNSLIVLITLHLLIIKMSVPVLSLLLNYKLFKCLSVSFSYLFIHTEHTVGPRGCNK